MLRARWGGGSPAMGLCPEGLEGAPRGTRSTGHLRRLVQETRAVVRCLLLGKHFDISFMKPAFLRPPAVQTGAKNLKKAAHVVPEQVQARGSQEAVSALGAGVPIPVPQVTEREGRTAQGGEVESPKYIQTHTVDGWG